MMETTCNPTVVDHFRRIGRRAVPVYGVTCWTHEDWRPLDPRGYTTDEDEAHRLVAEHREGR